MLIELVSSFCKSGVSYFIFFCISDKLSTILKTFFKATRAAQGRMWQENLYYSDEDTVLLFNLQVRTEVISKNVIFLESILKIKYITKGHLRILILK